jgi:uncharacterized protein
VRAGGHAVVWETPSRARMVFATPPKNDFVKDLGYWSLLDMGRDRWTKMASGPYRGLSSVIIAKDCHNIVIDRAERDAVWKGATRTVRFDCLECGSCCRDNKVELDEDDIERFLDAGRPELMKPPFTRKSGGKVVLKLLKSKDCQHLAKDNKCGIYPIRPDACSTFPVASESCLYAREEELGIVDGLRLGASQS